MVRMAKIIQLFIIICDDDTAIWWHNTTVIVHLATLGGLTPPAWSVEPWGTAKTVVLVQIAYLIAQHAQWRIWRIIDRCLRCDSECAWLRYWTWGFTLNGYDRVQCNISGCVEKILWNNILLYNIFIQSIFISIFFLATVLVFNTFSIHRSIWIDFNSHAFST